MNNVKHKNSLRNSSDRVNNSFITNCLCSISLATNYNDKNDD